MQEEDAEELDPDKPPMASASREEYCRLADAQYGDSRGPRMY